MSCVKIELIICKNRFFCILIKILGRKVLSPLLLNVESDALMASLQEILKLSNEQLTAFTADFEARLPEYLRNALHPKSVAA